MHKLFVILILALVSHKTYSQEVPVKNDSVKFSTTKKRAIVFKGKKVALYDLVEDDYVIKPTKKGLIYSFRDLTGLEAYGYCDKDHQFSVILFREDEKFVFDKQGDTIKVYGPTYDMEFNYPGVLGVNNRAFLLDSMKYDKYPPFNPHKLVGFTKVTKDHLIISDYARVDEEFISSTDEERLDPGHTKSGVWDLENNQWLIPNKYEEINRLNNFYICSFRYGIGESEYGNPVAKYNYDLYDTEGKRVISQVDEFENEQLKKILKVDDVQICSDSVHYIVKKNGKKGFVRFQLFDKFFDGYPDFDYQSILPTQFDHLIFSAEAKKVVTYIKGEKKPLTMYQYIDGDLDENWGVDEARMIVRSSHELIAELSELGNERIIVDGKEFMYTTFMNGPMKMRAVSEKEVEDSLYDYFKDFEFQKLHRSFGINGHYNEFVSIVNTKFEMENVEMGPLKSLMYPGEDSIDANGYVVYPAPTPGYTKSGVFNCSLDSWEMQPQYKISLVGPNGMYAETQEMAVGLRFDGDRIESTFEEFDLLKFAPFVISEYKVDEVMRAPNGNSSHMKEPTNQVYFYTDGRIGLMHRSNYIFEDDFKVVDEPREFLHYNPDEDFSFWIENDSIYFKNKEWKYSAPNGSKLEYLIYDSFSDENKNILKLISNEDTTILEQNFNAERIPDVDVLASIELNDGRMILNDRSKRNEQISYYDPDLYWGDDVILDYIIENEASAIWEKSDSIWKKKTPYYAMVEPVPPGYIVKTGRYFIEGVKNEDDYESFPEVVTKDMADDRYILLNGDLKPYAFMDMYDFEKIEDLGFGISIQTIKGKFFVSYDGKAITSNEWDWFELEEGKLKAGRDDVYEINEWGEPAINEDGQMIYLQKAAVKYFDLD